MKPQSCLSMFLLLTLASYCSAQSPVEQASHQSTLPASSDQLITFQQTPARVGDRVAQHVTASLDLQTNILQANKTAVSDTSTMRRNQQRFIEITQVEEGRAVRARVLFPKSRLISPENKNPKEELKQPVEGKSYNIARRGKNLSVTDTEGNIPTMEEFAIVVNSLQSFGLPSPLAKFLLGQKLRVGEKIQVPLQIASEMMGFSKDLGQIQNFEFTLQEIRIVGEERCAVFAAKIDALGDPTNPIRMAVQGQVVIETDTCRTVSAELHGPLTMKAVEKTPEGEFQYSAAGEMRVAIHSQYGYAAK